MKTTDPTWTTFKINFGKKHKGKTIAQIWKEDPKYIRWLAKDSFMEDVKIAAQCVIKGEPIGKVTPKVTLDMDGMLIVMKTPFELKDVCSDLSQRVWDPDRKAWCAPGTIIKEVNTAFDNEDCNVVRTEAFINYLEGNSIRYQMSTATESTNDFEISDDFGHGKKLMPFQEAGVEFLETTNGCALIGDQMGLGKTVQALGYLQLHPELRPAIVVCPSSLRLNWKKEAYSWLTTDDIVEVVGTKTKEIVGDIIIINYDILKKNQEKLDDLNAKVIILDESHYIKNKSQRTTAGMEIASNAPHRILLTGTPLMNRPRELWNQLRVIDPVGYPEKGFFRWHKRFCNATQNEYGWDFNGASNIDELAESLKNVMIRRLKSDVLAELPEKQYTTLPVIINNRREYDNAEQNFIEWVGEHKGIGAQKKASRAEHLAKIEALKQVAAEGKIKAAFEWITTFLQTDEKLVVFATHKSVIAQLMKKFSKVAVKIDGSCSMEERQDAVDAFQNDPDIKLFVGNIKAAGVGITLTAASDVMFLEFPWTPADLEQACDRVHRITQKDCVNIYYFMAENTIDVKIIQMLEEKKKVIDGVMDEASINIFNIYNYML